MAEILKDVFEDEKGNQHYLANNTETTFDQNGTPLNNGGDLSEASVNFTVSSSRKALTAKARFKALMGDIAKWLTDLGPAAFYKVADDFTTTAENYLFTARKGKQLKDEVDNLNQNLDGNRFGHTADGRPGWKDGADTVHPFSTPAIISMIQLLPGLNNYAGNVITLDVTEKNKLHIDTMQSWYDDANISIDADGTTLFSKKHQTGGSNRVDTTEIGDIDVSQYSLITINFSVVSKNGQGWGKLNNIVIS
ncbi:hypothetical protein [Eisenbergiella massiliensis]|uniref:Uncharacterized protein n=1 Tax=Eisenbergiella massiliensis TaxID=1720294 RepID=A0A3E3IZY9_9FIRM|nr:hypothetical protein [Eisenbergiella massiliensis]RGE72605.1 hypothetical protein DWY69_06880 [Eisenbergiella massiliensis]